jgi:ElaB/YqjD/DUF883 family membrane-anchored ribosome-binding protein
MIDCKLTDAEINHLRRLLAYVRCDIGQSPEEMKETIRSIAPAVENASDEGKERLVAAYKKAESVPKYVRAAVKALEKTIVRHHGEIVDADANRVVQEIPYQATEKP